MSPSDLEGARLAAVVTAVVTALDLEAAPPAPAGAEPGQAAWSRAHLPAGAARPAPRRAGGWRWSGRGGGR